MGYIGLEWNIIVVVGLIENMLRFDFNFRLISETIILMSNNASCDQII